MYNYKVWAPLEKIDRKKYLYHYTSVEKAIKILYYETLQFSSITTTNDIFEQKPKLSFEDSDIEISIKAKKIQNYFNKQRNRVKILCFSQDNQKIIKDENLPKDKQLANVIGRGFALPRMWAQYASNSEGVCFIINKEKLLRQLSIQEIDFIDRKVEYVKNYSTLKMNSDEITLLCKKIDSKSCDVISEMIKNNFKYVKFNYFTKLDDWKTENEYRIIIISNEGSEKDTVKINNLFSFLEGIVIGYNINDENRFILKKIVEERKNNFIIRQIYFDNTITSIQDI